MSRNPSSTHHRIYLLSVWREQGEDDGQQKLRFRLEDPRTGEQWFFTNEKKMGNFIKYEISKSR
jgi:hypothetical protein